jgi:predicted nucleic acid-binding protein
VAAANRRDQAHLLAAELVTRLGRDLVVPEAVIVEVDQLLRSRVGGHAARLFLAALTAGEHSVAFLTPALLRRAAEIDARHADLGLGFTDASVMALAERHDHPILTFDFEHFRAAPPQHGYWRLVVDESRYAEAIGAR